MKRLTTAQMGGREVHSRACTVDFFLLRVLYPSPSRPLTERTQAYAGYGRKKSTTNGRGAPAGIRAMTLLQTNIATALAHVN